jgi:hypothetical protein
MRRNTYDLSHEHKTTADFGQLIPVACVEVLPGDTFIGSSSMLARIAPMAHPTMHRVDIRLHHWYVPNRIIWSDFEDFITGANDALSIPTVTATDQATTPVVDRLGAPCAGQAVNALPIRAYNKIYNEFYRDQDLQTERAEDAMDLARICWEKDYFTTCRANAQQGSAVQLGFSSGIASGDLDGVYMQNNVTNQSLDNLDGSAEGGSLQSSALYAQRSGTSAASNPAAGVSIDLSAVSGGIDINELRRSIALQRFAEARERYGERFVDYLRFLGVNPSDGRLDRPEYLGGGSQLVNFSEVLATADGASNNIGDLYGHGIAGVQSRRYRKMFEEHGYVITLMSARPKTVYQQAVPKHFLRSDVMDYWQKELEVLPWQEVYQNEVYAGGSASTVFGYQQRYDDYRHAMSYVSGGFRQSTEEDWHLGREFASAPTLNASFVECTPSDRIFQGSSLPELVGNVYNSIRAKRLVRPSGYMGTTL